MNFDEFVGTGNIKRLPEKLSDLLEIAIEDAQAAQRVKGVQLDMAVFCEKDYSGSCHVCLAGAAMVHELGETEIEMLPMKDRNRLYAIDDMRLGQFSLAYSVCGNNTNTFSTGQMTAMRDASYVISRRLDDRHDGGGPQRAPWCTYRRAIRILRKAGL